MKPKISVVIPTYNRSASLIKTLKHLENQNFKESFEVIIVDDWSTDFTQENLKKFKTDKFELVTLKQENKKQWAARNYWFSVVRSDLIVFLQDDIWAEKDLLKTHFDFHKKMRKKKSDDFYVSIWKTEWIDNLKNDRFHRFLDWSWNLIFPWQLFNYDRLKNLQEVDFSYFYTNNLAIQKTFFDQEKFNEKFDSYWWEDIEIWYRLSKRGMKIFFLEKALAKHNHKYTFPKFLQREKNVSKSLKKLFELQPELKEKFRVKKYKEIIFYIFSKDIFLSIFKLFHKEAFWYFSAKKVWLKYMS